MKGTSEIKYSDVVSTYMGMNVIVMLGGGSRPPIEKIMIIFQNDRFLPYLDCFLKRTGSVLSQFPEGMGRYPFVLGMAE